jgi:excisionase family DNA binding protein
MNERQTLSFDEAAAVLTIGVPTLEELIARGLLRTVREHGETCVRYDDLLAYLRDSERASLADDAQAAEQREADR